MTTTILRSAGKVTELDDATLTRSQIAEILNQRGILTGQGKSWDKSRIRLPLEKARALIADDEQKAIDDRYALNPNFGLF